MRKLSFASKLYLALLPLGLMGLAVAYITRTSLRENATAVIEARRVKEMAVTSLAHLLMQDDATKAMIIDPAKMVEEPGRRKIEAYDANVAVLKEMDALSHSAALHSLVGQLTELDAKILRPLDTELLEALAEGKADAAKNIYYSRYEPQRAKYEALLRQVGEEAEAAAGVAVGKMKSANQQSVLRISAALFIGILIVAAVIVGMGRQVTRQLKTVTAGLSIGAEDLRSASNRVFTSSQSLSEGASQQAASLEETSASLEEMSSMSRRNAENAQTAKDLATQTRSVAEGSAGDMQQMSEAMDAIRSSSNGVAKIIKSIDEIAFQTNILALNAAVEAARAGEAGMGFAVVADEVRNLAQRSAQAARETADKIEDSIQKSERGVQISGKVAQSFQEIVTKTQQVDSLVAGIATASSEQCQGIIQINSAVTQMDHVTQNNAAGAEESASAAEELKLQAKTLQLAVIDLMRLMGDSRTDKDTAPSADVETTLRPRNDSRSDTCVSKPSSASLGRADAFSMQGEAATIS